MHASRDDADSAGLHGSAVTRDLLAVENDTRDLLAVETDTEHARLIVRGVKADQFHTADTETDSVASGTTFQDVDHYRAGPLQSTAMARAAPRGATMQQRVLLLGSGLEADEKDAFKKMCAVGLLLRDYSRCHLDGASKAWPTVTTQTNDTL